MSRKPMGMAGKQLEKAIAAQQAGKRTVAESLFETVLRSRPDSVDALYLLGTMRAEDGKLASAQALLQRAAQAQPDSPYIHNNLGNVLLMQGQLQAAAEAFAKALARRPDMIEAEINLGLLMRRMGDSLEAEKRLRSAAAKQPAWPQIRVNLAIALGDQGRREEAVVELREALEHAPDFAPAHEMIGLQLERLGRRDEAIGHLKRYLELAKPGEDDSEVSLMLARLGLSDRPERYPLRPMLREYERKASRWDADVARPGMEFLGPQHVREFVDSDCAGTEDLAIADLGCGTGLCGPMLKPLAATLVGVDLSRPMLDGAREKRCYDELLCEDLLAFLGARPQGFDLMVASGVLILFADLAPVLAAASDALRPGGRLMFTAYRSEEGDIAVRDNLHFGHSPEYLRRTAVAAGLEVLRLDEAVHEYDYGEAQAGLVVVLGKP